MPRLYKPLISSSQESLLDDNIQVKSPRQTKSSRSSTFLVFSILLIASISINIAQATIRLGSYGQSCKSPYIKLNLNVSKPFGVPPTGPHVSPNLTEADLAWNAIDPGIGMVALAQDPHLQRAEAFPWDKSKGVFMLESHHALHCLKLFYFSMRHYQQNLPQPRSFLHVQHCLDTLREDVLCNADDTPRASGSDDYSGPVQLRQCRDFSKLEAWAKDHSACFRRFDYTAPEFGTLDEWLYCPPESPFWQTVQNYIAHKSSGVAA